MALRIDKVQLQFDIKPNYDQHLLQKLEDDLKKANRELTKTEKEIEKARKQKPSDPGALTFYPIPYRILGISPLTF